MPPKKKSAPRGAGPGARPATTDPGIDIVFDKPKPKSKGHRQRSAVSKQPKIFIVLEFDRVGCRPAATRPLGVHVKTPTVGFGADRTGAVKQRSFTSLSAQAT